MQFVRDREPASSSPFLGAKIFFVRDMGENCVWLELTGGEEGEEEREDGWRGLAAVTFNIGYHLINYHNSYHLNIL